MCCRCCWCRRMNVLKDCRPSQFNTIHVFGSIEMRACCEPLCLYHSPHRSHLFTPIDTDTSSPKMATSKTHPTSSSHPNQADRATHPSSVKSKTPFLSPAPFTFGSKRPSFQAPIGRNMQWQCGWIARKRRSPCLFGRVLLWRRLRGFGMKRNTMKILGRMLARLGIPLRRRFVVVQRRHRSSNNNLHNRLIRRIHC